MPVTANDDPARGIALDEILRHRSELSRYCARLLRSSFEADDAVQETMVRAWRNMDGFEGRSTVRSWLYRIATNVCIDMLRLRRQSATAEELDARPNDPRHHELGDPAHLAESSDALHLALAAALRHLPPAQLTVLVLRDGLSWRAPEVAELLGTSTASVNSALQRARGTLAAHHGSTGGARPRVGPEEQAVLAGTVNAFRRRDAASLVALLG